MWLLLANQYLMITLNEWYHKRDHNKRTPLYYYYRRILYWKFWKNFYEKQKTNYLICNNEVPVSCSGFGWWEQRGMTVRAMSWFSRSRRGPSTWWQETLPRNTNRLSATVNKKRKVWCGNGRKLVWFWNGKCFNNFSLLAGCWLLWQVFSTQPIPKYQITLIIFTIVS